MATVTLKLDNGQARMVRDVVLGWQYAAAAEKLEAAVQHGTSGIGEIRAAKGELDEVEKLVDQFGWSPGLSGEFEFTADEAQMREIVTRALDNASEDVNQAAGDLKDDDIAELVCANEKLSVLLPLWEQLEAAAPEVASR